MIIAAKKKNLIAGFIFMVDWFVIYKNNKELAFRTPDSDYFRNYNGKILLNAWDTKENRA